LDNLIKEEYDEEKMKDTALDLSSNKDAVMELEEAGNMIIEQQVTASSNTVRKVDEIRARNGAENGSCQVISKDDLLKGFDDSTNSFISKLFKSPTENDIVNYAIDFYIEQRANDVKPGKGIDIRKGRDKGFNYACERLPLKDDECYVVSEGKWIYNLVAGVIPFGNQIKDAYDAIEDTINEGVVAVADFADDFGLRDVEELLGGSCFAANQDMMAIAEIPGKY
jgi:hypothetical protein